jgi:hypothetical protein
MFIINKSSFIINGGRWVVFEMEVKRSGDGEMRRNFLSCEKSKVSFLWSERSKSEERRWLMKKVVVKSKCGNSGRNWPFDVWEKNENQKIKQKVKLTDGRVANESG